MRRSVDQQVLEDGIAVGRRVWSVAPPSTWTRDLIEQGTQMMAMAVAEAGHPVELTWSEWDGCYVVPVLPPENVMDRARALVFSALGMEYVIADRPTWIGDAEEAA